MGDRRTEVELRFDGGSGLAESDQAMEFLLEELALLEVLDVAHRPLGAAPSGARAGDLTAYTSLILGVAGAPSLRALIALAQDWLARRNSGTIEITVGDDTLRMTSVSRADQRLAVEGFLAQAVRAGEGEQASDPADA